MLENTHIAQLTLKFKCLLIDNKRLVWQRMIENE